MAALALMTAACSSDDNDLTTPTPQPVKPEGIPFSATIESESATTRALSESGNTITAEWADNEEVALIYTDKSNTKQLAVAKVTAHDDGSATITTTLTAIPDDDADVEIVYPASTVDVATKEVKDLPTLLSGQSGELSNISKNYDLRKATGKLKIENETASLKERVKLTNQLAILRIQAKKPYNSEYTLEFNSLTVTIDGTQYFNIQKLSGDQSYFYIALPPVTDKKVSFLAKDVNGNTYGYSKSGVTFEAGKYYQSTLKMMGAFSVGADKRVCFSQGNLQYDGSTWKFAENQWGILDYNNTLNTSSKYPIDLFTWGNTTLGEQDYMGTGYDTSSSTLNNTKAQGTAGSDWGYNAISNGGNKNSQWRTLTISEWQYLLTERTVNGGKGVNHSYTVDQSINGIKGLVIYPDGYKGDMYSGSNWDTFEHNGCVFLPAGGYRKGQNVYSRTSGYYWSADPLNGTYASYMSFENSNNPSFPTTTTGEVNKDLGYSVRLVRDL